MIEMFMRRAPAYGTTLHIDSAPRAGDPSWIEDAFLHIRKPLVSNPLTIRETPLAVTTDLDWTGCRSPARAKRRRLQGHPQRVAVTETPTAYLLRAENVLVAHPLWIKAFGERLKVEQEWAMIDAMAGR